MKRSTISKHAIRDSFSKASSTYDSFSLVQKEVNRRLLGLVPDTAFKDVLEIGCGTGGFTRMLLEQKRAKRVVALDISYEMLLQARKSLMGSSSGKWHLVSCDGEKISIVPGKRFELIVSASCMHWFHCLDSALSSTISHYLAKRGGVMTCALFGRRSLLELQEVVRRVSGQQHLLLPTSFFPTSEQIYSILKTKFDALEMDDVLVKREYPSLLALLRSLKHTGTSPKWKKGTVFGSKKAILEAEHLYKKIFGSVTATFQVIFFRGKT